MRKMFMSLYALMMIFSLSIVLYSLIVILLENKNTLGLWLVLTLSTACLTRLLAASVSEGEANDSE
jgi:hypothetical protein